MRCIPVLIGTMLLFTSPGFTETLMTAQDYAVDSDVVLESAVSEVKAIPHDTVNIIGDTVKYGVDEVVTAEKGVKAVFRDDPVDDVRRAAALETASAWDSSNDILFRSYKVASQVGKDMVAAGRRMEEEPAVDVSGFFDGIEFPDRASAYYRPEFGRLMIRQTPGNILAIEALLAEHHNAHRELMGHQVEIETRFVEVSQQTLDELGFSWTFNNHNGEGMKVFDNDLLLPTGSKLFSAGLRTAASAIGGNVSDTMAFLRDGSVNLDLVINAMEQAGDTDVLSAPRIVTRSGQEAIIQVGEEEMFPARFRVDNLDTSPLIEYLDWDRKLMGVQLEVTPDIREGGLIDLKLHPRVVDVIGFDSYEVTPEYQVNELRLNPPAALWFANPLDFTEKEVRDLLNPDLEKFIYRPVIPVVTGALPYFRIREMTTEVTVADGSTIGMGGLIYDKVETFRDKVPVLGSIPFVGRLFRSEGERSVKRNLMIFVTATEVDVNGRRNADIVLNK